MPVPTTDKVANKLINEKSPYLLQHAYNPVDWYPWGDEAFKKAKTEDKPIFLSIGYSTCHWCHVMEKESFEDQEVADILNKDFISIKVDREERPDIDNIYMTFCQAINGNGGWPLTIIMTPEKKPFFAGTYFAKGNSTRGYGLMSILEAVINAWEKDRKKLISSGDEMTEELNKHFAQDRETLLDKNSTDNCYKNLSRSFDKTYGGFGSSPKFPTPHNLLFLLRYGKLNDSETAINIVENTLQSMYKGGIFDHIGFGFSRYSTDRKWLVPHFEKMLYDNALLIIAYSEAYQLTQNQIYKEIAQKIITYILRDMTSPEGGFYSAEDADSEGVEGKFYIWDKQEIDELLSDEDSKLFTQYYDITEKGNFEGKNIPNLINQDILSMDNNSKLKEQLESIRKRLFEVREKRVHPHKDDKILTSWNGLMIAALAYAGRIFNDKIYTEAAEKAAHFILDKLTREDGRLLSRYRDGEANFPAYAEDYAFLVWGLIELYENTFDTYYLKKAISLNDDMIKYFWDDENGGFFFYGNDSEKLIMRPKEIYDGAIPSGNSVAAYNMLRISRMINDEKLERYSDDMFKAFAADLNVNTTAHTFLQIALLYKNSGGAQIAIAAREKNNEVIDIIKQANSKYIPFTTILFNNGNQDLLNMSPSIKEQLPLNQGVTVHVCENFKCSAPITDPKKFNLNNYKLS